jgi:hypothetical protein
MKKIILMMFLLLPVIFLVAGCAEYLQDRASEDMNAGPRLQERCERKCEEYFRKEYGNGKLNGGKRVVTYQTHYNKKLKKCMIMLDTEYFSKNINMGYKEKFLLDVNYKRGYGFFHNSGTITFCDVERNTCRSEQEWVSLVKPYMED